MAKRIFVLFILSVGVINLLVGLVMAQYSPPTGGVPPGGSYSSAGDAPGSGGSYITTPPSSANPTMFLSTSPCSTSVCASSDGSSIVFGAGTPNAYSLVFNSTAKIAAAFIANNQMGSDKIKIPLFVKVDSNDFQLLDLRQASVNTSLYANSDSNYFPITFSVYNSQTGKYSSVDDGTGLPYNNYVVLGMPSFSHDNLLENAPSGLSYLTQLTRGLPADQVCDLDGISLKYKDERRMTMGINYNHINPDTGVPYVIEFAKNDPAGAAACKEEAASKIAAQQKNAPLQNVVVATEKTATAPSLEKLTLLITAKKITQQVIRPLLSLFAGNREVRRIAPGPGGAWSTYNSQKGTIVATPSADGSVAITARLTGIKNLRNVRVATQNNSESLLVLAQFGAKNIALVAPTDPNGVSGVSIIDKAAKQVAQTINNGINISTEELTDRVVAQTKVKRTESIFNNQLLADRFGQAPRANIMTKKEVGVDAIYRFNGEGRRFDQEICATGKALIQGASISCS